MVDDVHDAEEVRLHDGIGVRARRLLGPRRQTHAGVVDEHVDFTVTSDDGVHALLDGFFVRDVHLEQRMRHDLTAFDRRSERFRAGSFGEFSHIFLTRGSL